jgi:hypothetical protein
LIFAKNNLLSPPEVAQCPVISGLYGVEVNLNSVRSARIQLVADPCSGDNGSAITHRCGAWSALMHLCECAGACFMFVALDDASPRQRQVADIPTAILFIGRYPDLPKSAAKIRISGRS